LCVCYKQAEIDTIAELRLRRLRAEAGTRDGSHSRRGGDGPITAADAELARVDELWVQHRYGQARELTARGAQRLAEEEDVDGAFECLREAAAVLQSLTAVRYWDSRKTNLLVQTSLFCPELVLANHLFDCEKMAQTPAGLGAR
jgi:hypothetical protein